MNMNLGTNSDYYYELHPVDQYCENGMQKFVMLKKKRNSIVVGNGGMVGQIVNGPNATSGRGAQFVVLPQTTHVPTQKPNVVTLQKSISAKGQS